ncbi:hypothetical protein CES85_5223 [Ochrobactrum quorumnocens]|uniref:Uncharacterized protein n=1 Tax=Ochrobactrum quorumnocens TaxID=271865 RepID=A0A248UDN2_9HYPH|nr:hypothetical protein CES85_5223 [[Ochrobactrum] quorumnocens]
MGVSDGRRHCALLYLSDNWTQFAPECCFLSSVSFAKFCP